MLEFSCTVDALSLCFILGCFSLSLRYALLLDLSRGSALLSFDSQSWVSRFVT
jgi:hypothetical protein